MENQVEASVTPATPEEMAKKGIENTLGVIKVVEGLFNASKRGTYPLDVTEQMMAGLSFLAQFHSQLVSQLPPAVVEDLRKAKLPVESAVSEVSNDQPVQA